MLSIGDTLVFLKRPLDDEKIIARVTNLVYFKDFKDLGSHYDMKRLYLKEYSMEQWLGELARFYSDEEIEKYGVVAIEFEIIN